MVEIIQVIAWAPVRGWRLAPRKRMVPLVLTMLARTNVARGPRKRMVPFVLTMLARTTVVRAERALRAGLTAAPRC